MLGAALREIDQAADGLRRRQGHRPPGQQVLDGVAQVVLGGRRLLMLVGQSVVHGAPVGHGPGGGIDDDHLAGAHQAEGFADELGVVEQHGQVDGERLGFPGDGGAVVLQVGVEQQELDPPGRELVPQRLEAGQGVAHDRAAVALNHDHHRRRVAVVVEVAAAALVVQQPEVVDPVAGLEGRGRPHRQHQQEDGGGRHQVSRVHACLSP